MNTERTKSTHKEHPRTTHKTIKKTNI